MEEQKKNPELSFEGSGSHWKTWKIGDLITEAKRPISLDDETSYQLITVKRRNEGVVSRGRLKGKDILVKNYYEVREGDYVISKRQIVHGANGIVPKVLDRSVVSNEYLVIASNEKITTRFWTLISKLSGMYKIFFLSSFGVDIEKLVFDVEDWKKREICIPNVDEQLKIIRFFDQMEGMLNSHQKKHDRLVTLKKSLLEKMFPNENSCYPKMRFNEFHQEWNEVELGDLCRIAKSGGTPSSSNKEYYSGDIPFLAISDMTNQGKYLTHTTKKISQKGLENSASWFVPSNTIIYSMYASVGFVSINKIPVATSQAVINLILKEGINVEYVYYFLVNYQRYLRTIIETGTQGNLNAESVKSIKIKIPSLEEQEMLSKYFASLDLLISSHKQQLNKLTKIKQALSEKMFV